MIECPSCYRTLAIDKGDFHLPPWCPFCGADLKRRPSKPSAPAPRAPVKDDRITERAPDTVEEALPPTLVSRPILAKVDAISRPAPAAPPVFDFRVLALALLLLSICSVLTYGALEKVVAHRQAQGQVVKLVTGRKGRLYPEVAYQVHATTYKIQGGSSTSMSVGDPVVVLYPVDDPGRGTIQRFSDLWLGPILTGFLGASCLLLWFLPRLTVPREQGSTGVYA